MPRHKLEPADDINFLLYGICSNAKDYRFCWALNKSLNIHLARKDDVACDGGQFAFFTFDEENLRYYLIANKNEGTFFSKEFKQMDYLLTISGNYELFDEDDFLFNLKKTEFVLAAYRLNPQTLKFKLQFIIE